MNLVMFDIDGTLTATTGIDQECFVKAVEDVMEIDGIDTDLTNYTHVTDESIAAEIIERHRNRQATEEELSKLRTYFVGLIERHTVDNPSIFQPVPGADEMLNALSGRPDCGISLATGGWRSSALLKMEASGLELSRTPMATSDDARSREQIMQMSEEEAKSTYGSASFDSVIYVGDGLWDLKSSQSMGYAFVGVGTGDHADMLRNEGAQFIVADFEEDSGFLEILETLWGIHR